MIIIEILMLIGGLVAVATGKLPSFLFGGQYTVEGLKARLLGALFIVPLGVGIGGGILLSILFGQEGAALAGILEILSIVGVLILSVILFRFIRQPVASVNRSSQIPGNTANIEALIAKKAQGALIYSLLGILGFTAIIVCPLAFLYAGQALRLMDEYKTGEQHRQKASLARVIAPIVFLFYASIAALFILLGILGSR